MRWNVWILPVLVFVMSATEASRAQAQDPPGPAASAPIPAPATAPDPAAGQGQVADQGPVQPPPPDPKKLADLLALWERNSSRLKTLDVTMKRVDKSPAWNEDEHYEGRALLKSPNFAFLDFKKIVNKEAKPYERIVCTGSEVWQYRSDTKQIFIYPLEKDMQQRALEEGPLPFLFNFQAAAAQKRYHMDLVSETEKSYVLRIIPKLEIDRESFTKAWVQLDRKLFLLPTRIFLLAPDGSSSKDFTLTIDEKSPNCEVMDENFKGKLFDRWKVVRNPGGDARPGPRPAQGAPAAVKAATPAAPSSPGQPQQQQPAMKSRLFRRN